VSQQLVPPMKQRAMSCHAAHQIHMHHRTQQDGGPAISCSRCWAPLCTCVLVQAGHKAPTLGCLQHGMCSLPQMRPAPGMSLQAPWHHAAMRRHEKWCWCCYAMPHDDNCTPATHRVSPRVTHSSCGAQSTAHMNPVWDRSQDGKATPGSAPHRCCKTALAHMLRGWQPAGAVVVSSGHQGVGHTMDQQ
jgi:hypothetical protein